MKTIITAIAFLMSTLAFAQIQKPDEYKINMSSGKLVVKEVNKVAFEGYSGSEIIVSTYGKHSSKSERAEGLRIINGSGLEDNTEIGLAMNKENGSTILEQVSRRSSTRYLIKVPANVTVKYEHSTHEGSRVTFKNMKNELEISTNHNSVTLENVTGPMTINTVHGKIEGNFSSVNQSSPISIASVHGLVDLSLPSNSKANLRINSNHGEIYSDLDITIEKKETMTKYSNRNVRGTLNGGGVQMSVESSHGNVYLRKQK